MNILLVQTSFLGDVVLSTAVISSIKKLYPEANLFVLTTPLAKDLVAFHPDVSETLVFDKRGERSGLFGLLQMAAELRKKKFSIVFSLHKSWRTALLLLLAGIPERYGFREAAGGFLYSSTTPRKGLEHDVLRNLAILRVVGQEPESLDAKLHIEIPEKVAEQTKNFIDTLEGRKLVGLAPGSVWETKRWSVEGFSAAAGELAAKGYGIVLIGGPGDEEIAAQIANKLPSPYVNLTGQTSLIYSVALIREMDVLVSNDSAPLHMASAVGTSVVAVFCATSPEFGYGPWQVPNVALGVKGLDCRPCRRHGSRVCPTGTEACMKELSHKEVVQAVEDLLQEGVK